MAQSGYTPILIYASGTATNVPLAADMTSTSTGAELAINYADGKLYYKNSSNVVTLLASTSGASGDVVGPASATDNALARFDLTTGKLIQNSVGILSDAGILTGLTGLTSSGPITLSSLTSGRVTFAGASGLLSDSANFTFAGSTLALSSSGSTGQTITSVGTNVYSSISFSNTTTGYGYDIGFGGSASVAPNSFYIYGGSTASVKLAINSSGNLGIGTSSPSNKLTIADNSASAMIYGTQSGAGDLFAVANSASEKFRITNAGLVGIGTSSPSVALEVAGNMYINTSGNPYLQIKTSGAGNNPYIRMQADTNYWDIQSTFSNTNDDLLFQYNGTALLDLDKNGNLGLGVTPSAWNTGWNAFQIGSAVSVAAIKSTTGPALTFSNNAFLTTGSVWNYITSSPTNPATQYEQYNGGHIWYNAGSGTGAITWTQAMTLQASGNLLVGTTSALSQVARATVVGSGNAFVAQCGNGTTSLQTTNTSGTGTYYAAIFGNNGNTFSTCGIISVSGSTTTYDTASSTSVGAQLNASGITFRPTQSASADANTLDDYEEGTWTLTLTGGGGSATVSSTARYTKIGNIVTLTAGFDWTSSTLSGAITIGGFPFATSNVTANYRSAASFGYTAGVIFAGQLVSDAPSGSTTCAWLYLRSGTTPTDVVLNSSGAGQFCFTYQVA